MVKRLEEKRRQWVRWSRSNESWMVVVVARLGERSYRWKRTGSGHSRPTIIGPGDRRTLDTPVARHVRKISTWSWRGGGGEGKKCFTSVMRDTRGRKLKLPSVSPSGFFLPLSPRPWQIYYRQTLAPLRPPNDQPELLSFSSRRRKRDHLAGDWFSTVENLLFQ